MLGADFERRATTRARQWPNVGEIDIMEYVGREPDLVIGHASTVLAMPAPAGSRSGIGRTTTSPTTSTRSPSTGTPTAIAWFYDGEPFFEIGPDDLGDREWVFDHPFFLILNLALGGTLGGNIALDLEFPIRTDVDYVRVYQSAGAEADE